MRLSPAPRAAFVAALALLTPALLVGCDSAGTADAAADAVSNEEAAVSVGAALAADGGGALDAIAAAAETPAAGRGGTPEPGCEVTRQFDAGTTTWTRTVACERSTPNGRYAARYGRTQQFRFFAGGTVQQDPATADALTFAIVDGYGERRTPVLRHRLLDVGAAFRLDGLDTDTVGVEGTYTRSATDTLSVPRPAGTVARTLVYTVDLDAADVRVVRGADGRRGRPVAGTVTGTIAGTATRTPPGGTTRTRDFSRTFTLTFSGGEGTLVVGGDTFGLDLATGDVE